MKKLGEVCEINYGTRVVQKKDGGTIYPVYGGGGATFKMDRYNREDCLVVSRFAMSSQCVRYVRGKFFLNDSGLTVRTNKEGLSQKYLDKCILSLNDKIYSLGKGVAQKNLDIKEFKNLYIRYPALEEEQSRIVEELDQLSNIIEKKRQQLSELDNLAQAIFYDMFGDPNVNEKEWDLVLLSSICCNFDYKRKPITAKDRVEGNIPYYGASGIVDYVKDCIFDGDYLLVSEDGANLITRHTPIAFHISGKTWVNNHAHILRFDDLYMQLFVEYYINLLDISDMITGCAQPKLTQGNLNNVQIFSLPTDLQQLFAQKVEAIEKEKALIKRSIAEVEELFNSRMEEYFG